MNTHKQSSHSIVRPTSIIVGLVIAAIYLMFLLLVPSQVATTKLAVTNPRVYPYVVFSASCFFSLLFALVYKRTSYEINLGIWPLVLGTVIFYFGMKYVGFYLTSFFMVLYNAYFWKHKKVLPVIVTAALTPILCYVFFTLCMKIYLPAGVLFS